MEPKKTHREVKEPQIPVQGLADYMAASERGKRTVVQRHRYRPTVRLVQYNVGKEIGCTFLRKPDASLDELRARAEQVRSKLADDDFDVSVNEGNADLLLRLAAVRDEIDLPVAEMEKGMDFAPLNVAGVKVTMRAGIVFRRVTRTNKIRVGAMLYRYAKGKPLAKDVGELTSAGILGFLKTSARDVSAEPERPLCVTLCGYSGKTFAAPGDAIDIWNDMRAACASIAERWPNIPPPPNAIL